MDKEKLRIVIQELQDEYVKTIKNLNVVDLPLTDALWQAKYALQHLVDIIQPEIYPYCLTVEIHKTDKI